MPEVSGVIETSFAHGPLALRERWRLGRTLKALGYDQAIVLPNAWKSALAGRPNVTFESYPGLNHLLIAGTGTPSPGEYSQPGHVAARVVDDLAAWIAAPAAARKSAARR